MHILGIGASFPETVIPENLLSALLGPVTEDLKSGLDLFNVKAPRTSLKLEYIEGTKNEDILGRVANAAVTPTELGLQAVDEAITRAGITADSIGMVVADCSTPYQTTPSEAQRIAGRLGLKVPTYDFNTGPAALFAFIDTILKWNKVRLPDYILCISTNTPTQHVNYQTSPLEARVFGDAAFAFVISPRETGKWILADSMLKRTGGNKSLITIDRHIKLDCKAALPRQEISAITVSAVKQGCEKLKHPPGSFCWLAGPEIGGVTPADLDQVKVTQQRAVRFSGEHGFALGASSGAALSSLWNQSSTGDSIVAVHCSDGTWVGTFTIGVL